MDDIDSLYQHVTHPSQINLLNAIKLHGSTGIAARSIGMNERNARRALHRLRAAAEIHTLKLDSGRVITTPAHQYIKATSTLYDTQTGEQKLAWVKTDTRAERLEELMRDSIMAAFESYKGQSVIHKQPKKTKADLLTVYPFGDPHIGMYAWSKETGADFDCDTAHSLMFGAVDRLCDAAPDSDTCLIISVGDTFHADTFDNRSLNSGHSFDVDTRWSRVLEIGVSTMMRCIDRALQKHKRVIFKAMQGNHDKHSAIMLSTCLSLFYSNNKRVTIDTSPSYFWYHKHGKCLIGATHGDTCKPEALPGIMADDRPEDWGSSLHRYWYTGHIHTHNVKEFRGVLWESFRTLAPRDAWHASKGYGAGRDMYAIVLDKEHGEIERHRCDVSKLMG